MRRKLIGFAGLLVIAASAAANTVTVNSTSDVANATDGLCTLREAITAVVTNTASGGVAGECAAGAAGLDTIAFAIPGAGVQTITFTSDPPDIGEPTIIDGYTQPGSSPNTLATGDNAVILIQINGGGFTPFLITIPGSGSTIRGFNIINSSPGVFMLQSTNDVVTGNFFGTDPTGTSALGGPNSNVQGSISSALTIGGTAPADRNIIVSASVPGVLLSSTDSSTVQGNYIGTDKNGTAGLLTLQGIQILGPSSNNVIGGSAAGAGNVIGSYSTAGIDFNGTGTGNTVQGNLIGTDVTGTADLTGGAFGIVAESSSSANTIGGPGAGEGNVISGAAQDGIDFLDIGSGWVVQGNKIGTDITGTAPLPNGASGICSILVGGGSITDNVIAFNRFQGIALGGGPSFEIFRNSIFSNGNLGISLSGACDANTTPFADDPCDLDVGPNLSQNKPIIIDASLSGNTVTVSGLLNSATGTYIIDVYANAACDPTGNGEGQTYIGSTALATDAGCIGSYGPVSFTVPPGQTVITVTARDAANNTSEFSPCFAAVAATTTDVGVTKSNSPDPVTAGNNLTYTVTVTNSGTSDASNVTLTDVLPANTTFVSFTAPAGWTPSTPAPGSGGTVTATIPTLVASGIATFTLVVNVNNATPATTVITNTATVTTTTTDTNSTNDSATSTATVAASADLGVTKTDTPDPATAGSNITYTITVTNAGPSTATAVTLSDAIPANTTFVSFTVPAGWTASAPAVGGTGTVTATNASFAPGTPAVFTLVVNVNAATAGGTITNTATVSSTATTDPTPGNNATTTTTTVSALQADLGVTKSGTPPVVGANSTITYTITVDNAGPSTATSVVLSDVVPANTVFESFTAPAGWTPSTPAVGGTGTVTATNPSLASGASGVFTLVVRTSNTVPNGTTIANTATVSAATADGNSANNSATSNSTVGTAPAAVPALSPAALLLLIISLAFAGLFLARRGS